MTVKTSPKKVKKNPLRPKSQPRNYNVTRYFQPGETSLACHSSINAVIPYVNVENQNSATPVKNIKIHKTVCGTAKKVQSVAKEPSNNNVSAFERAKSYHFNRIQAEQKKAKHRDMLKSSSSSSIDGKIEKFTRTKSKSFHETSKKHYETKQLYLRSEKGSTSQATSSTFKSTTDPALLHRVLKVKNLKQEILENRRATSNVRYPSRNSSFGDSSAKISDLTKEISQSKTNNIAKKKILITELHSEIAQYKQYKNFLVYNSTEEPSNLKNEAMVSSNNESSINHSSSSQKRPSGGKRVSILVKPENIDISLDRDSSSAVLYVKSRHSSRSRSRSGTDPADSVSETRSNSKAETLSDRSGKSKELSDPESADDEVIRYKIKEANQLIERVRKALSKIKAIQSGDESTTQKPDKKRDSGSSSTDIEETIKGLKLQTKQLLQEDTTIRPTLTRTKLAIQRSTDILKQKSNIYPSLDRSATAVMISKEKETIMTKEEKTVVKSPRDKNTEASQIVTIVSKSKIPRPVQQTQTEECSRRGIRDCCQVPGLDMERPMTRRNEAAILEDDLMEQVGVDKFRTVPDTNQLEVSSSFEELQEKLKTIAETTESNRSTPRRSGEKVPQEPPIITMVDNCSNCVQLVSNCNQQIQVKPDARCMGVECHCQTHEKSNQGRILPALCVANRVATDVVPPRKINLKYQHSPPLEIEPTKLTCTRCNTEFFFSEVMLSPTLRKMMCENCKSQLKEDFVGGISIEPQVDQKIQNLSIKLLPPVIIKQPLKVTKVLDLSINSKGDALNRLRNRTNVTYVDVIHGKELGFDTFNHFQSEFDGGKTKSVTENEKDDLILKSEAISTVTDKEDFIEQVTPTDSKLKPVLFENKVEEVVSGDTHTNHEIPLQTVMKYIPKDSNSEQDEDEVSFTNAEAKRSNHSAPTRTSSKSGKPEDWKNDVRYTLLDTFNKHHNSNIFDVLDKEKEEIYNMQQKPNLTEAEREELKKKLLWYQSYHIYDNPNLHDPGRMDQKSLEKVSHVDLEFYKTFINPDPMMSGEITPVRVRSRSASKGSKSRFGYESKQVQVQPSLLEGQLKDHDAPQVLIELISGSENAINREIISEDTITNKEIKQFNAEENPLLRASHPPLNRSSNPAIDSCSQVTLLNIKENEDGALVFQQTLDPRGNESKPILEAQKDDRGSSTPSEITVTISYTLSEEEHKSENGSFNKPRSESPEIEINSTLLDRDQLKKCSSSKTLTLVDKDVMDKLRDKLRSVDTTASLPGFTIHSDGHRETLDNFLKGLTKISSQGYNSPKSENTDKTINYVFTHNENNLESLRSHLELAENGRYKDEQDLFTQIPYPISTEQSKKIDLLYQQTKNALHDSRPPLHFNHLDEEVKRDKYAFIPRRKLKKYSPDQSNSDTVTSTSLSEGEIGCRHTISIGEVHVCRHRPQCPKARKRVLNRGNLTLSPSSATPRPYLSRQLPKKFDLNDPSVSIEQRRTYFNNWVTYYVKPQEVYQSSTSNFSDNK
ncbi:uncharacterized protein LOC126738979 isoform X2 [Anthonomus grandis grandis]|uniref:uncharacterized protein LOC126738979 isoform X2 n=1 Tax=Anthonomus grandis grandis TaxID=2921223 RepID=UPI0021669EFF|nr:uncharacterized protein LOC126738979 isoform X2 [Anthonomus grandis grandis]